MLWQRQLSGRMAREMNDKNLMVERSTSKNNKCIKAEQCKRSFDACNERTSERQQRMMTKKEREFRQNSKKISNVVFNQYHAK